MNFPIEYPLSLLFTIVVEFIVIFLILRREPAKLFIYSIMINAFTQPLATYAYQTVVQYVLPDILRSLLLIELLVFVAESFLLKRLLEINYKKAVILSFAANLTTAVIGWFLFSG